MTRPSVTQAPRQVQTLLAHTWRDADRRPGQLDRQAAVTTALRELDEAARIDPTSDRTLALALKARDLMLLERLSAEAVRSERSLAAQAAARIRGRLVDYDPELIRAWALENGHRVPARGRFLPGPIVEAYRRAQCSRVDATARPDAGAPHAPSSSPGTGTSARSRSPQTGAPAASSPSSAGTSSPTPSAAPTTPTTSAPSASRTPSAAAASSDNS